MKGSGITIYIGNLNYAVDDKILREKFENFGKVEWLKIILKPDGKKSGIAFVHMPNESQAQTAIRKLNASEWMGRKIKVSIAEERFDHNKHSLPRSNKSQKVDEIKVFTPSEKPKKKYGLQVLFDHLSKNLKK